MAASVFPGGEWTQRRKGAEDQTEFMDETGSRLGNGVARSRTIGFYRAMWRAAEKLFSPVGVLWMLTLLWAWFSLFPNEDGGRFGESLLGHAVSLAVTAWLLRDSRRRGIQHCYDYGTFAFFAWPIMAPIHLFRTRGWRALLVLLAFIGMWVTSWFFVEGCLLIAFGNG